MLAVAIGFFDGVHLGHRRILSGADVAVTFRNHPLSVLAPVKAPRLIMSFDDRVAAIRACGVREVMTLNFSPELASLSPESFVSDLRHRLRASVFSLRCGSNWRFGRNAAGDPGWLRDHGIPVEVVDAALYDGAPVSSTRIRECLARGEIAAANAMLDRRFRLGGTRVSGKGEGANIGYPTINLAVDAPIPLGVYQVEVDGLKAVANYGHAPTFGERAWKAPVLEVHLLEAGALRGDARPVVEVEFVKFLRPERKFASPEALKVQIAADIAGLE